MIKFSKSQNTRHIVSIVTKQYSFIFFFLEKSFTDIYRQMNHHFKIEVEKMRLK